MKSTYLSGRGLLKISGPEGISFLQGLITQDARLLEAGQPIYAALLTPQGKYLHDFFLYPHDGAILLDGEAERLEDLYKRLKLYKLRSDVTIEPLPEMKITAIWGEGEAEEKEGLFKDPRLSELGWRMVGEATGYEQASEVDYDAMRLAFGVPDGSRDMIPEKSLMLECGMDKLNAVNFEKGCYVGQEVTARSKFRGQVRKQLYCVKAVQGTLPDVGTDIMQGDKKAGLLRSHNGTIGLALLRTEMVNDGQLTAADCSIAVTEPAWRNDAKTQAQSQ